jgi:hypothetical protein
MDWIGTILTAVGSSVTTCVFMEAYYQRRAQDQMGEHDAQLESDHRAG